MPLRDNSREQKPKRLCYVMQKTTTCRTILSTATLSTCVNSARSGSKGRIWKKLSLQQLRRPLCIHKPFISANAVIMCCMECIWISYCMLLDRAHVCMRHAWLCYPFLPFPDRTYRTLPACLALYHAHLSLCVPDLTYLSLSFNYCRMAGLHCTMQPGRAITTPAP